MIKIFPIMTQQEKKKAQNTPKNAAKKKRDVASLTIPYTPLQLPSGPGKTPRHNEHCTSIGPGFTQPQRTHLLDLPRRSLRRVRPVPTGGAHEGAGPEL